MEANSAHVVEVGRESFGVIFPREASLSQIVQAGRAIGKPRTYREFIERLDTVERLQGLQCVVSILKAA